MGTFLFLTIIASSYAFFRQSRLIASNSRRLLSMSSLVPADIVLDVIPSQGEALDFGQLLASHKKAVLFAVPGAFTPTWYGTYRVLFLTYLYRHHIPSYAYFCCCCSSSQHLPGFIAKADELRAKGVDGIYCLSVNDKYVMQAWAEATPGTSSTPLKLISSLLAGYSFAIVGCMESGIKLVADGVYFNTVLHLVVNLFVIRRQWGLYQGAWNDKRWHREPHGHSI